MTLLRAWTGEDQEEAFGLSHRKQCGADRNSSGSTEEETRICVGQQLPLVIWQNRLSHRNH